MDQLLKLLQENAALRPAQLAAMLNRPESEVAAQINVIVANVKEAERFKEQKRAELAKVPAPRED